MSEAQQNQNGKNERKLSYRNKMIIIISVIVLLTVLYYLFKEEIYTYSCRTERVGPACLIVGMINEENHNQDKALDFYLDSCELEYALGCNKLAKYFEKSRDLVNAKKYYKMACSLGYSKACQYRKD